MHIIILFGVYVACLIVAFANITAVSLRCRYPSLHIRYEEFSAAIFILSAIALAFIIIVELLWSGVIFLSLSAGAAWALTRYCARILYFRKLKKLFYQRN